MKSLSPFNRYMFLLFSIFMYSGITHAQSVDIKPLPDWAELNDLMVEVDALKADGEDEAYIVLGDSYSNFASEEVVSLVHAIYNLEALFAINNSPRFNLNYISKFQTYAIHKIVIHRNDNEIDASGRALINFIEVDGMAGSNERQVVTTVNITVPGLRKSDKLEIIYSISGYDDQNKDFIFGMLALNNNFLTQFMKLRQTILIPEEKDLNFSIPEDQQRQVVTTKGGIKTYFWDIDPEKERIAKSLLNDPNSMDLATLTNLTMNSVVYFSEIDEWDDFYSLWEDYYLVDEIFPKDITRMANELTDGLTSDEEKIKAIYAFMIKEFDYLEAPLGRNGYIPMSPSDVLRGRYGDCKDQALLMVYLLKSIGIEAYLAFVNSNNKLGEPVELISPLVFDHAIIYAKEGDKEYWLDPTLTTYEDAPVWLSNSSFKKAYLFKKGETSLRDIPQNKAVNEYKDFTHYNFPNGLLQKGQIRSQTISKGAKADIVRAGIVAIGKDGYKDYITEGSGLGFDDEVVESELNIIEGTEDNNINIETISQIIEPGTVDWDDNFYIWSPGSYIINEYVLAIDTVYVGEGGQAINSDMFSQDFPMVLEEEIVVDMPWQFKNEEDSHNFATPYHKFDFKSYYEEDKFIIKYRYETLKAKVAAEDFDEFIEEILTIDMEALEIEVYNEEDVEVDLSDGFKNVFSTLYRGSTRTKLINRAIREHYVKHEGLRSGHITQLEDLLSREDLPKDTRIKAHWYHGVNLFNIGRFDDAETALQYVLENTIGVDGRFHSLMGNILFEQGRYSEANDALIKSVELLESSDELGASFSLSTFARSIKRYYLTNDITDENIESVEWAISQLRDDQISHKIDLLDVLVGMAWKMENYEKVISSLKERVVLDSNKRDWRFLMLTYKYLGDLEGEKQALFDMEKSGFTFEESEGDHELIYNVNPIYPKQAEQDNVEGFARGILRVDEKGKVTRCIIEESEPGETFDKTMCLTAMHNRYFLKPVEGDKTEQREVDFRIEFRLND